MALRFEFAGFFLARRGRSIDDDQPAPRVKRLKRPIQNDPGMSELVISVRHQDSIDPAFRQMRVVRLTVNNLNVTPMAQEGSDPKKR